MKTCSTSDAGTTSIGKNFDAKPPHLAQFRAKLHRLQSRMEKLQVAIALSEANDIEGAKAIIDDE